MSISTQRTIKQLQEQCEQLGLVMDSSIKKPGKTEYINLLRGYYLSTLYPNGVPEPLKLMLNIESPMLCSRITELKPEMQNEIWESPEWIFQQKLDGVRFVMVHVKGKTFMFSRNISVNDFLPIQYQDNVWFPWSLPDRDFIVDCELTATDNVSTQNLMKTKGVVTETCLQAITALISLNPEETIALQKEYFQQHGQYIMNFNMFDVLYLDGEWQLEKPYIERHKALCELLPEIQSFGVPALLPPSRVTNKRAFYKYLVNSGMEGVVAKNIHSKYVSDNTRQKMGWVKIKRSMSEQSRFAGLGDTIDGFITGFEEADPEKQFAGLVGCLKFSVILRDADGNESVHEIGRCANISLEDRKKMTVTDTITGKVSLNPIYLNRVYELDGAGISARALRLRHCRIVRNRLDKSADQCVVDKSFLLSQVL